MDPLYSHCALTINNPTSFQFVAWPLCVTRDRLEGIQWECVLQQNPESQNIPEKTNLTAALFGKSIRATAKPKLCLEGMSAKKRERKPYGHEHYRGHTTFWYRSLGDWPILPAPVHLVSCTYNAVRSPVVWACSWGTDSLHHKLPCLPQEDKHNSSNPIGVYTFSGAYASAGPATWGAHFKKNFSD